MDLAISKLKTDIKELKQLGGFPRVKKRIESYQKAVDYLELCDGKNEPSEKEVLPLCGVVQQRELLFAFMDYMRYEYGAGVIPQHNHVAERFLKSKL